MHRRICTCCEKEFETEPYVTVVAITDKAGFDTIRRLLFCSWTCKSRFEARVREEFEESDALNIGR